MTRDEILTQLKAGKLSVAEASEQLASLTTATAPFTMKVSDKGAITMRGVPGAHHQFGMTLYAKGLEFLFAHEKEIKAFIAANKSKLSWEKPAKAAA